MSESVQRRLAALDDDEVETCLRRVLGSLAARSRGYGEFLASPEDMTAALAAVAAEAEMAPPPSVEPSRPARPPIVRAILAEMAADDFLRPQVEAALAGGSPAKFADPIMTSLVLAGILAALSTSVSFECQRKDGKWHFRLKVEKKATSAALLDKFLRLLA